MTSRGGYERFFQGKGGHLSVTRASHAFLVLTKSIATSGNEMNCLLIEAERESRRRS